MLDFGLNIFFEQMDALQERVELLEQLISTSLQERRDAESALQRAEEAYAGLKGEHERTGQVLVKVREELQHQEETRGVQEKEIAALKKEMARLEELLGEKTECAEPAATEADGKIMSEEQEASEKKPRVPKKRCKEAASNPSAGGATQLFFSFDD